MIKKFDILTFGSITLDTFIEPAEVEIIREPGGSEKMAFGIGQKIKMRTIAQHVGGGSANTSVGFAKLGLRTASLGTIGDDDHGEFIKHRLQKMGVETKFIQIQKNTPSSTSIVFITKDGRRTIFHERTTHAHIEDFPKKMPPARAIYVGHLYETGAKILPRVPEWKKSSPGKTSKIFAWNPGKTQFRSGFSTFKKIFPSVDMLILNIEEAELFTKSKAKKIAPSRSGAEILWKCDVKKIFDARTIAKKFLHAGVKRVVITDGQRGAQFFDANGIHLFTPPLDKTPPVSTLGAGDSFSVGVVSALLRGEDSKNQMFWGSLNSNSVIRQFGAQEGLLTLREMLQKVKKTKNKTPLYKRG